MPEPRGARPQSWVRTFAPAFLWALLIFWVGGRSHVPGPDVPGLDKVGHFAMYGALGALLAHGWNRVGRWPALWIPVLAAVVLGALDETRQAFVPGRTAALADWIADMAGVLAGFAAVAWITAHSNSNANPPS